jgi:hypothetical protein
MPTYRHSLVHLTSCGRLWGSNQYHFLPDKTCRKHQNYDCELSIFSCEVCGTVVQWLPGRAAKKPKGVLLGGVWHSHPPLRFLLARQIPTSGQVPPEGVLCCVEQKKHQLTTYDLTTNEGLVPLIPLTKKSIGGSLNTCRERHIKEACDTRQFERPQSQR